MRSGDPFPFGWDGGLLAPHLTSLCCIISIPELKQLSWDQLGFRTDWDLIGIGPKDFGTGIDNIYLWHVALNPIKLHFHMTHHDHDRRMLFSVSDVVCHVSISASIFLTLAITKERHSAITSPFTYQIRIQNTPRSRWAPQLLKIQSQVLKQYSK